MVQLMWLIDRWQGDHTGNSNPANITINSDTDVTAIFINREYSLSVNTDGEGSVSERVVPAKTTDYPHGTTVELTANPSEGWEFVEWQGDLTGTDITLLDRKSTRLNSSHVAISYAVF